MAVICQLQQLHAVDKLFAHICCCHQQQQDQSSLDDSGLHAEDDFDDVAHKSDDEEGDVMSTVAAIAERDAQLQSQLPEAYTAAADDSTEHKSSKAILGHHEASHSPCQPIS